MAEETTNIPQQEGRIDRRHRMAQDRRKSTRLVLIGALIVVVVLLVAVLVTDLVFKVGYISTFVLPPRELVVRVDDVSYTRGDMVKLLRVRQKGSEIVGGDFNASTDIFQALQLIVENELIAQEAPKVGITVTDNEVDFQIRSLLAPTAAESGGKTEEQLEREFKERYGSYLNTVQVSEEEHRQIIRRAILRERFRQYVGDSVPTVAQQVRLHRIAVNPNDELTVMKIKYEDYIGLDETPQSYENAFFNITREFSRDDAEIVRRGGDLGWAPAGIYEDYDYVMFNLKPGELSSPVSDVDNPGQMLVFMVSEKSDAREITPGHRNVLKNKALQDWINENRKNHDVYAVFNSEIYTWMIEQLGISSSVTPEPQSDDPLQNLLGGGGLN